MFFFKVPDASTNSFKVLLIASEIIIPLIVFVGAYFIFKPLFNKKEGEDDVADSEDISDNSLPK